MIKLKSAVVEGIEALDSDGGTLEVRVTFLAASDQNAADCWRFRVMPQEENDVPDIWITTAALEQLATGQVGEFEG